MDTFAHGLWATAAATGANKILHKKLRVRWMAFWGVMPDLFSFTPAITWVLWLMAIKGVRFSEVPRLELLPPPVRDTFFIFRLTNTLYCLSHSLVLFSAVFVLVWGARWLIAQFQQPPIADSVKAWNPSPSWEMTGWLLHIALDIPSHSKAFYPTPFLWPLLDIKLNGFSWGRPWFMVLNYTTLLFVFILLRNIHGTGELKKSKT